MTDASVAVLAAGALCWRATDGDLEVLVVRRDRHADVSLPKGKLDPGETLPQTAVREVAEETGYAICLGAPLGTVEYRLPTGREKVVYYWAAEVEPDAHTRFRPSTEVAALEWIPLESARTRLTYEHDVDVVDRFARLTQDGHARTFALIALRHGKAVPREEWDGEDAERPLLPRGRRQAESIAPAIAAFRPAKLVSSDAVRCVSTVEPTARRTGLRIARSSAISQDAFERGEGSIEPIVRKRLASGKTSVLCSHGPVLPELVGEIARLTNTPVDSRMRRAGLLSTGEFSVLHVPLADPGAGIVAVEVHGPAT